MDVKKMERKRNSVNPNVNPIWKQKLSDRKNIFLKNCKTGAACFDKLVCCSSLLVLAVSVVSPLSLWNDRCILFWGFYYLGLQICMKVACEPLECNPWSSFCLCGFCSACQICCCFFKEVDDGMHLLLLSVEIKPCMHYCSAIQAISCGRDPVSQNQKKSYWWLLHLDGKNDLYLPFSLK